jgi:hypothetical protein
LERESPGSVLTPRDIVPSLFDGCSFRNSAISETAVIFFQYRGDVQTWRKPKFFDCDSPLTRLGGGFVGGPLVLIKGLWLRVVPMAYDPWPLGLAFLLGVIVGHHFSTVCPW